MRRFLLNKYWIFLLRFALGLLFILWSLDKIIHPVEFAKIVNNYRILPPVLVNLWALVLPWIELTCGVALILGLFTEGAILVITGLLIIFIGAMGQALIRGIDTACGCFKVTEESTKVGWERIGEDVLMLLGAINIVWARISKGVKRASR
jgi:uncharacterized membrane protein YphA (DoxX/SURF4 family)